MFGILKSLSSEDNLQTTLPAQEKQVISPTEKYENMRLQPTLLSAVEGTLSSFFKEDGDSILDYLETLEIKIYFDDNLSGADGCGYYIPEDNVIVLSSQPDDVLDIARELHRVLKTVK